ncbi:MAG: hypothetical protein J0I42_07360 [Bosea sp.]|uniref:hypothetical protein n=1 Tax=Bosea sp. (in: a-proteobacteria) TaxID=1871050 RepID=UPI001AD3A4EB|nr:hypothetical protein [Bosea sp. (in: a-proteobacteria)]MBN9451755.1 hypothetical protein [Bosea sp. (in: a-proteobacteria)]
MSGTAQHRTWARRDTRALVIAFLGLAVGSCTNVAESRRIEPVAYTGLAGGTNCRSQLGSYALPKGLLTLTLTTNVEGNTTLTSSGGATADDPKRYIGTVRVPDEQVCLDFTSSPTAEDNIQILKAVRGQTGLAQAKAPLDLNAKALPEQTPFLGAVLANSIDRSGEIAARLIRTAFIAISGDPRFDPKSRAGALRTTAPAAFTETLTFDPFDPHDSARANTRLTAAGYCLVIDGYTFHDPDGLQRYCNNPGSAAANPPAVAASYVAMREQKQPLPVSGLMYRPRTSYTAALYAKPDRGGREPWRLWTTEVKELENLSPVLSLQIGRNIFAGRRAAFLFDEGALVTSCLSTTSEVAGFVEIPLEISRSLVSLPERIISIRIGAAERDKTLALAEKQVLDLQRKIIEMNDATILVGENPKEFTSTPIGEGNGLNFVSAKPAEFSQLQKAACGT